MSVRRWLPHFDVGRWCGTLPEHRGFDDGDGWYLSVMWFDVFVELVFARPTLRGRAGRRP